MKTKNKTWDEELQELDQDERSAKRIVERAERFFLDFAEKENFRNRNTLSSTEVESVAASSIFYSEAFEEALKKEGYHP